MLMKSCLRYIGTFPPRIWPFQCSLSFYQSILLRACPIFALLPPSKILFFALLDGITMLHRNSCNHSSCKRVVRFWGWFPMISLVVWH
jgi:hypothetical protein